jgi:type VII secretion-associated protein (TIGR03931 family)
VKVRSSVVCEIGPGDVRRIDGDARASTRRADPAWAAAALDGADDPLTLLGDRPVAVESAWHTTLEPLVAGADEALLIHPSWWSATRIGAVGSVAGQLVDRVVMRPRSWLLSSPTQASPVVEIAPRHVVVTGRDGAPLSVQTRAAAPDVVADTVARAVLRAAPRDPVWIDGPAAIPGAVALAALIGARLRTAGCPARVVDEHRILSAAASLPADPDDAEEPRVRSRMPVVAAAGGVLAAAALVVGLWPGRSASAPSTALVEARVTLQIPADWMVRRITTGPGSARVQVSSPADDEAALHITQSPVLTADLAGAAATLREAIAGQPRGVFVDFRPADVRAGRPAVTYREVRPSHDIRWAVLLEGGVRISIGCQSAPGRESAVTAACEQAVGTAHQIG